MKSTKYIKEIIAIFKRNEDLYNAHKETSHIFKKMVSDDDFLRSVVNYNLNDSTFLNRTQDYPTLSLPIYKDDLIEVLINVFPNLPSRSQNVSFQSIHHHGNLMLSTIGISGPGYETLLFNKDFIIEETGVVNNLKITSEFKNEIGKYTFCDAFTPHIVFYPKSISSTLVVWSKSNKNSFNKLKQLPIPKGVKRKMSSILSRLGLRSIFELNDAINHDFYPKGGTIEVLKNRIGYGKGDNETFLQNFFHYLKSISFNDQEVLNIIYTKSNTTELQKKWIIKFLEEENIEPKFLDSHQKVSKAVNIHKADILKTCEYV